MKKQTYRIELIEEPGGFWRYEIWVGDVCRYRPEVQIGDERKSWVRTKAIANAESQPDYGSHVVKENYRLV